MDVGHYVNSPAAEGRNSPEKREKSTSGLSRVFRVAVVGFGLLCIIHSAINICLRIQGFEFCNKSELNHSANVTLMSPADVSTLLLENERLAEGNINLIRYNKILKDQLSQRQDHIQEIQNAKDRLEKRLVECELKPQCCPLGWTPYKSSCYQLSTERQSWAYAKQDCEAKDSHLVIIDDETEMEIVLSSGSYMIWIGLRAKRERGRRMWTWLDGIPLSDAIQLREMKPHPYCAYLGKFPSGESTWDATDCTDQNHWMCEKELK
ncbi:C-type lectin domain family 6 member A-like [Sparus aurata]|uniref:C-type lectin domain family 6 member A-like n=1 Tax=Sparus aurata TaxID=8175 RepID=UPI0011C17462|nr:C-type lectin domain family 6 member A-like [Sparus aurata]